MKKVPFSKIRRGGFFRLRGKTLYQRGRGENDDIGQIVTGTHIGRAIRTNVTVGLDSNTLVTPVNACFVIEG